MAYREHLPHPALGRYVECYWSIRCAAPISAPQRDVVLPDGCMDILFDFGSGDAGESKGPTAVGAMTRPLAVLRSSAIDLMGVRFKPGGAAPFLDVRATDLTDRTGSLDTFWGRDADSAYDRIGSARTVGERVRAVDDVLLARLERAERLVDQRVLRASELATESSGAFSVDRLAAESGLGRRQLERRFLASVGLPPKVASRVARFRAAVARLHADPDAPLSRVALECGYADQPHFSREFRALVGMPPGEYRKLRGHE